MSTLNEGQHTGEFIVTEADGTLSRDTGTVLSGQTLQPGHVLGQVTVGSVTAAAQSGNTGNGTIGSVSAGSTAKPGIYIAECIEPATNSGTFQVTDPNGIIVGDVVVGSAFAGPVHFTIADGATDFVAGDRFNITVAAGSGKYKEYNPSNTDGSETPTALSYAAVDASGGDTEGVVIVRDAEVNAAELIWFSGATDNQKAAALATLKANNSIIAR